MLAALTLAALVAACSSGHGARRTAATPTAGGPALGSAFAAVLQQVRPDGSVTTETALQAFALSFGPLPGVSLPPGDPGTIPDGTAGLRWLVGHWRDITAEQRAAAVKLIPDLAKLAPVTAPTGYHPDAARGAVVEVALPRAKPRRSDTFYTQYAQHEAQNIAAKVGVSLSIPITAHVGLPLDAGSDAETSVFDGSGGYTGAPAKCDIVVSAKGDKLDGDDVGDMITHEVWHCFEGQYGGLDKFWSSTRPGWIIEGESTWVGNSMYPNSKLGSIFWPLYLKDPGYPLFSRTYTAVGFYSQLAQSGVDVWSKLIAILQAKDNVAAYNVAGGTRDDFLDLWASGYARDAGRGTRWDITGPAITSDRATPQQMQVGDGATATASAQPYTNQLYAIADSSSEVLLFTFTGHARVSDASGKDYLLQGGGTFCHRSGGCTCPNQDTSSPPMLDLPGPTILLAVTGGPTGASGGVAGTSLKQYCNRSLTGTWVGTWADQTPDNVSGGFTVIWTQKGNTVSGTIVVTGTPCITAGTVVGTLTGNTITFGAVQGARTVTYTGTVSPNAMSGTYSAPACGDAQGVWSAHRK